MVLRSGEEVDNKVSGKEPNKEERLKTIESDLEIEKENDPTPTVTYRPMVPYLQTLDASFPSKNYK